jgi:pimeloyl-ACP methyl ester carboxylesterase
VIAKTQVEVGDLLFDVRLAVPPSGPTALLLHGFPENASMWDDIATRLADMRVRSVAPDQRGYSPGARPSAVEAYGIDELVGDVVGIVDALGLQSIHVVGHDWGAVVAWHFAARHPERVSSLVAVSVPHPRAVASAMASSPDQRERSAYIGFFRKEPEKAEELLLRNDSAGLRALFRGSAVAEGEVDGFVRKMNEPGALRAALSWYGAAATGDAEKAGPVSVPTTYIWGEDDIAIGKEAAEACGDHVQADFRFVPVPEVGHWVPEEQADLVTEQVLSRIRG